MRRNYRPIVELLEDRSAPGNLLGASLADPLNSNLSLLAISPFDSPELFQSADTNSEPSSSAPANSTSLVGAIVLLVVSSTESTEAPVAHEQTDSDMFADGPLVSRTEALSSMFVASGASTEEHEHDSWDEWHSSDHHAPLDTPPLEVDFARHSVQQFGTWAGGFTGGSFEIFLPRWVFPVAAIEIRCGIMNGEGWAGAVVHSLFPPGNPTMEGLAYAAGVHHVNWYQVIVSDTHPLGGQTPPYVDPPPGGYPGGSPDDNVPWYWTEPAEAQQETSLNHFHFSDGPQNPPTASIVFKTWLVGLNANASFGMWSFGFMWRWDNSPGNPAGNATFLYPHLPPPTAAEYQNIIGGFAPHI